MLLKKYINIPKNDIITNLIKHVNSWDIFSLSSLYLHIFGSFYKVYKSYINEKHIFTDFICLLSDNIHPNPLKRNNIDVLINYCICIYEKSSWNFINSLPIKNMENVFIELSK